MKSNAFKSVSMYYNKHKAPIDTAVQACGIFAVLYLAARAGRKTDSALAAEQNKKKAPLTKADKLKVYSWLYWPSVLTAAGVSVYSGHVNFTSARRIGAVTAIATAAQQELADWKAQAIETVGVNKATQIQSDLVTKKAQQAVEEKQQTVQQVPVSNTGVVWCYDDITGHAFLGTIAGVEMAEAALSKLVTDDGEDGYASVKDWIYYLNKYNPLAKIETRPGDFEIGWFVQNNICGTATGAPDWKRDSTPVGHDFVQYGEKTEKVSLNDYGPTEIRDINGTPTVVYVSSVWNEPVVLPEWLR